jgi:hypothetical protein
MYDFLRDDKMWTHIEDTLTTAFFQRTDAPTFDPYGDGWERQQFNQRHFPDAMSMDTYCPSWRETMPAPPGPLLGSASIAGHAGASATVDQVTDAVRAETARLRAENVALISSTSWRITAPLRALSSMIRRR